MTLTSGLAFPTSILFKSSTGVEPFLSSCLVSSGGLLGSTSTHSNNNIPINSVQFESLGVPF